MAEASELKPCPFCGTSHSLTSDVSGRFAQIVCEACGARGPEIYRSLPYSTMAKAWNVRSAPSDVNDSHRAIGVIERAHNITEESNAPINQ